MKNLNIQMKSKILT